MSLVTPEKIRTLQRKLYAEAERGDLAGVGAKLVREPDAGELRVRFDERVRETEPRWGY